MKRDYTSQEYEEALRSLDILPHHLRMLQAHYHAPRRTITATQMSAAMGYTNFMGSNLQYGRLGRLVGERLGWLPDTSLYVLSEFEKPNREWLWIMRPQVAEAIEALGWVDGSQGAIPEEVAQSMGLYEGATRRIAVNAYERNSAAREECILHYGCSCSACGMLMSDLYGEVAQGHVHVHHLKPLSEINREYQVDPVRDLRPVCPNCHAVIHMKSPPYSIEEVMALLKERSSSC